MSGSTGRKANRRSLQDSPVLYISYFMSGNTEIWLGKYLARGHTLLGRIIVLLMSFLSSAPSHVPHHFLKSPK